MDEKEIKDIIDWLSSEGFIDKESSVDTDMSDVAEILEDVEVGEEFEVNNKSFVFYNDYGTMEKKAIETVEDLLDSNPESFSQKWLRNYITLSDTDRRLYAQDLVDFDMDGRDEKEILEEVDMKDEYDELQDELDNLDEDDFNSAEGYNLKAESIEEQKEKMIEDAKETLEEKLYDEYYESLSAPYTFLVEEQGLYTADKFFENYKNNIDIEDAAADAVTEDGIGPFLSSYDGEVHDTNGGNFIIRIN